MAFTTGTAALLQGIPVVRAAQLRRAPRCGSWQFANLVGVLSEISEETPAGALSFAAGIVSEAQDLNEPVAWVAGTESVFFPPDFASRGIEVSAVAVVRAGGQADSLTAAEWLLRSGALGLVVIDADGTWSVNDASLGRMQKLAERGQTAVVFLTRKSRNDLSLGSRISLRGCITRSGRSPFELEIQTTKDKRSIPGSQQRRQCHGPPGMH